MKAFGTIYAFNDLRYGIYELKRFCQMHAHIDHDFRGFFKMKTERT